MDLNGLKHTEIVINAQKRTETERNGQKWTKTERNEHMGGTLTKMYYIMARTLWLMDLINRGADTVKIPKKDKNRHKQTDRNKQKQKDKFACDGTIFSQTLRLIDWIVMGPCSGTGTKPEDWASESSIKSIMLNLPTSSCIKQK